MDHVLRPPKQPSNEEAVKKYAAFLCGLGVFVIVAHWLHRLCKTFLYSETSIESSRKAYLRLFRSLERPVLWTWLGRPSLGLVILTGIYLVANTTLCTTILPSHVINYWASRFGWMCAANMALCVFFGLKTTPLGLMAPVSHTQLNTLHRIVGYTAVFLLFLHVIFYTAHFGGQGRWGLFLKPENLEGIGAGVAMVVLLMGIFRHRGYEVFYVSHVVGFVAAVILTGMHRPNWAKKLPLLMSIIACVWLLDRAIRAVKMLYNVINNSATFYALPDGGTRIILKKPSIQAAPPGSYCFLWIPQIRLLESHPFTIVSNGPMGLELMMKSHRGFTGAVGHFASRHPRRTAWASIDGPYGSLPETDCYDKLILIVGGSGAAFTFGLMNYIMSQSEEPRSQAVEFVWAVKRKEHVGWFRDHLLNLGEFGPNVNISIFVTNGPSTGCSNDVGMESPLLSGGEVLDYETISGTDDMDTLLANDVTKHGLDLKFTKMNANVIINDVMEATETKQRVLVATCGPKSLMDDVRDSVFRWQEKPGVRIDVHSEDFNS